MQKCPNCGQVNRAGIIFCENCGTSLLGQAPLSTKTLDHISKAERESIGLGIGITTDKTPQSPNENRFRRGTVLRLEIDGGSDPIEIQPKPDTILGRRDPATGTMPDVDLTPFAGYRMGVSRRHAAIRHGEHDTLELWDLGSSNGTFLNNQRLSAHRPYPLNDGDAMRLGQMTIRVYFGPGVKVAKPAEASKPAPPAGKDGDKPALPAAERPPFPFPTRQVPERTEPQATDSKTAEPAKAAPSSNDGSPPASKPAEQPAPDSALAPSPSPTSAADKPAAEQPPSGPVSGAESVKPPSPADGQAAPKPSELKDESAPGQAPSNAKTTSTDSATHKPAAEPPSTAEPSTESVQDKTEGDKKEHD